MSAYYANQPLPDTNARQAAMTIRQPSTALLTIDSEDRYVDFVAARGHPTSPYNFKIYKNESLMPGFMTRIGVSEIVFPWTIPNINVKTCEIQFLTFGGTGSTTNTLVLPKGFYTPAQIATAIQTKVQAILTAQGLGDTFVMAYGDNAGFGGETAIPAFNYALQTAGNTTISFQPLPYNTGDYPFPPNTKQLYDLLGFVGNSTPETDSEFYIGGFTLGQSTRYVDIVCNQLTNSQAQKDQTSQTIARDMLCRVYLADGGVGSQSTVLPTNAAFSPPGCAPTVIYRNFTMPKQIQWIPNQNIPGYLQFQVYDDCGALLDETISGGTPDEENPTPQYSFENWSMTMLISEC